MNRFRNGQTVVCTNPTGRWYRIEKVFLFWKKKVYRHGPKKGELCQVIRYDFKDLGGIYLTGYEGWGPFIDIAFMPLQSDVIVEKIAVAEPSLN